MSTKRRIAPREKTINYKGYIMIYDKTYRIYDSCIVRIYVFLIFICIASSHGAVAVKAHWAQVRRFGFSS